MLTIDLERQLESEETMIGITEAEDDGLGGNGVWEPTRTAFTPGNETDVMRKYIAGGLT